MSNPVVDEVIFAYIAAALYAISFVLIRVESGIQQPVYYVSKSLNKADVRYLPITSKHALWSYSLSFHSSQYSEVRIILEGLPNGA